MQLDKAARLRKEWAARGSPPCDHSSKAKEYYLSSDTGDQVCVTCGEIFPRGEPDRRPGAPG